MLSSCIAASSGSIRTRTLCWPDRTGITCDRLPCAEAVGIKPNLFTYGAGDFARVDEITVYPYGDLRVVEAVLQPQIQGGILCGKRGVHRHEHGGGQEQAQYNPSFDRHTHRPLACMVVEQRGFGVKLCEVLSIHGVVYFRPQEHSAPVTKV
jgi:hypothetical protein